MPQSKNHSANKASVECFIRLLANEKRTFDNELTTEKRICPPVLVLRELA